MSVVARLREILCSGACDPEQNSTASEVVAAICSLLDETVLADDTESDKLDVWLAGIRDLRCKVIAEHEWEHDHCGYWGHQYCLACNRIKYPELARLSCSEALATIGSITEKEYQERGTP